MSHWLPDIIAASALMALLWSFFYVNRKVDSATDVTPKAEPSTQRNRISRFTARMMRQAGFPAKDSVPLYWSIKSASAVLGALLYTALNANATPGLLLSAFVAGFMLFDAYIFLRRRQRRKDIESQLGFFISLTRIYVNDGNDFASAIRKASRDGLNSRRALGKEAQLVAAEIASGKDRVQALNDFSDRCGALALQRVVAVLTAGISAGTPIDQLLKTQERMLSEQIEQQQMQLVNRKSMEAMLPMLLVSLPMFLVLVFVPAGLQLLDIFTTIRELF